MRIQILLVILLTTILFVSCKKDDPVLERDKFIGKWSGNLETSIKLNGQDIQYETIDIIETITAGAEANQILFSKNTANEIIAIVSDSTFNIQEQEQINILQEKMYIATITGTGILSQNHDLTISTKRVTIDNGDTIEWICTESLKLR